MSRRVVAAGAAHKAAGPLLRVRLSVSAPCVGSVPEVEGQARQHHNLTLAILATAGTAFALQQTMVIPALPALQHDLHTTTTW
jgi:glutamate racemase